MRNRVLLKSLVSATVLCSFTLSVAELPYRERLSPDVLDVKAPSTRVSGSPGKMVYLESSCRSMPESNLRSRIVNTAVQEWAYFGYSVLDLTSTRMSDPNYRPQGWQRTPIDALEASRVADSIAGYWSATPNSAWILERQNQSWQASGSGSRWRNPWSAAFISWVMCESGLGDPQYFQRAIAHHSYIDQAIVARDDRESLAAYVAYDPGEQPIVPGDMLCRGSRPDYESIAARRDQLGEGARTHCDIVVKLDAPNKRIMLIGGNVRGWVRLKLLPADLNDSGMLTPVPYDGRRIFAHLQLQAEAVPDNALEQSPSLSSQLCSENRDQLAGLIHTLTADCS